MTKPGRIPCINPNCCRTAPEDKYEPGAQIICRGCWKLVPGALKARYRQLKARMRKLDHRFARNGTSVQLLRIETMILNAQAANWQVIRDHFIRPTKPEGLDAFLEEVGL